MGKENKSESAITIVDLWNLCAARWRWFLISVIVCLSIAVKHLLTTPYVYTRQAAIMVLEESLGNSTSEPNSNSISDIGLVNRKNNVANVMRHISSLDVLMEVVNRLQLAQTQGESIDKAKEIQGNLTIEKEDLQSTILNLTYKDRSTR